MAKKIFDLCRKSKVFFVKTIDDKSHTNIHEHDSIIMKHIKNHEKNFGFPARFFDINRATSCMY